MSGCAVCVYDLYDDALTEYRERIVALQTALRAKGVPEAEWPARICARAEPSSGASPLVGGGGGASQPQTQAAQRTASMSAFEALEASLRAKASESAGTGAG